MNIGDGEASNAVSNDRTQASRSLHEVHGDDDDIADSNCEPSLQMQMELAMKSSMSLPSTQAASGDNRKMLTAAIKAEMAVFANGGQRGRCQQQVFNYLMSIPPTSVESERAFSAAGALCTKLRSRLSDRSLDTLCFLRSYYRVDCSNP